MKIYIAGHGKYEPIDDKFFDYFRLASYYKIRNKELPHLDKYKDFILDSGIFSYLNSQASQASQTDWDRYCHEYGDFVKARKVKNYVEIDVDRMIGLKEVERIRNKLHKIVGWKSIPVWHMNRGYDKWLELCRDYDYICFGAFLTDGLSRKKYSSIEKFIRDARKENCKVHGLGFTPMKWLRKLKFYSVDSTTWTAGNRFGGAIHLMKGNEIKIINKPQGQKIINHYAVSKNNFYEWIKFQRYAEHNL